MTARTIALPAALAILQMVLPAPAMGGTIMVPMCGEATARPIPLRIPRRDDAPSGAPCCKICHIAMRKRAGAGRCCPGEDDTDDHRTHD